jgi:hypothetical protein
MINKSLLLGAGIGVGIVVIAAVAIFAFSPKKKVAKQETQPNAVVATVDNQETTIVSDDLTTAEENSAENSAISSALDQIYDNLVDYGKQTGFYDESDIVKDRDAKAVYLLRASQILNVDTIIQKDGESYMYDKDQDKLLLVQYYDDTAYVEGYNELKSQLDEKYTSSHSETETIELTDEELINEKAKIIEEASKGAVTVDFIKHHLQIDPQQFNYYIVYGLQSVNPNYPEDSYILCESSETPKESELDGFLTFESDTRSLYGE